MKKLLIGLCLMLMSSGSFGLSIGTYVENRKKVDTTFYERMTFYLTGLYSGINTANHILQHNAKKKGLDIRDLSWTDVIFCPPGKGEDLHPEVVMHIIDSYLDSYPSKVTTHKDNPIAFPLLKGLLDTYPCK